jgi:serine/threonine-protein kinase
MAEVWRAEGPFGPVALKRLLPHAARDPSVSAAFEREGRLLSRIRHPNVIGIHEIVRDERGACLVLEYVEGADLRSLSNGPVPRRIALRIARDLLLALEAVHGLCDEGGNALGVIHRDLSPGNVLIGLDGRVKLTDFGISRGLRGSNATTGQSIKGTLAYLSPEQATKAPVDARSDLFSVGALLFEMLCGAPIYDEDDPRLALARARAGEVRSIGEKCADLALPVVELVDRALAASPADRFPNAAAMRAELERAAEQSCGLAIDQELAHWSAEHVGNEPRAPAQFPPETTIVVDSERRRAVPFVVAAAVLVLAVAIALAVHRFRPPAPGAPTFPDRASIEPPPSNPQPAATPSPSPLGASDDGARNATASRPMATARTDGPRAPRSASLGEPGLLDIGSDPAFAYVTIDGAKVGATPLFGRPLPPGTHRIEVSREGLGSKTFTLDVAPGSHIHRVVKLP